MGMIIGIAAVVIIGIAVGAYFMMDGKEPASTTASSASTAAVSSTPKHRVKVLLQSQFKNLTYQMIATDLFTILKT